MNSLEVTHDTFGTDDTIDVLRPVGVIDNHTAPEIGRVLEDLFAGGRCKFIIDLSNVTYISSAGWGIFVGEIRKIRVNNGDLKLACLMPDVEEVYHVLEFDTILKAYPSIDAAARAFS